MQVPEENYTLNLSQEINDILDEFNVTIKGTQEKRKDKRVRLMNYFLKQYYKFFTLELKWAYNKNKEDKCVPGFEQLQDRVVKNWETEMTEKQKYEDKLLRMEQDLLCDMKLMGEEGLKALQERHLQKIHWKLIDKAEEEAEVELLAAKG